MPSAEEQEKKTIELPPIENVEETTTNTPETIKDDSQLTRTSFTERIAAMVGMKPKQKEEVIPTTDKAKHLEQFLQLQQRPNNTKSRSHMEQRQIKKKQLHLS